MRNLEPDPGQVWKRALGGETRVVHGVAIYKNVQGRNYVVTYQRTDRVGIVQEAQSQWEKFACEAEVVSGA